MLPGAPEALGLMIPATTDTPPVVLGKRRRGDHYYYRFKEAIGRGFFGTVYRAEDPISKSGFAVKELKGPSKDYRYDEIVALRKLSHVGESFVSRSIQN